MLDAEDSVELRALQARAYGRAGALSDAEAARLRELEAARTVESAPPGPPESTPGAPDSSPVAPVEKSSPAPSRPEPAALAAPPRDSAFAALRQHWRAALVVTVIFVVAGLAAGWLLFADRGPAPMPLTDEQQEWQSAIIASGDFDAGSVRAMREEEGVVIWFATKKEGEDVCLVLGSADATAPACTTREQAGIQGVNAALTKPVADSQSYDIEAQMFLTPDGEPAIIARSFITSPQSTSTFASPAEADAAAALAEQTGLDLRTILVAGYDDDVPIWTGIDMSSQRYCLVYDGSMPDPPMVCDDSLMLSEADSTLALDVVGVDDGETTRYAYRFGYGQQYLTVTKGWEGDDAAAE